MATLPASSRPKPIRVAAQVQQLVEITVAATPNVSTSVVAARSWLKLTLMKGHATLSMASGRAMAKNARRARTKNTTTAFHSRSTTTASGYALPGPPKEAEG